MISTKIEITHFPRKLRKSSNMFFNKIKIKISNPDSVGVKTYFKGRNPSCRFLKFKSFHFGCARVKISRFEFLLNIS